MFVWHREAEEEKKKGCQKIYFPFIGGAVLRRTAGKEADVKACLLCLHDAASIDRTLQDGVQEERGEEEEMKTSWRKQLGYKRVAAQKNWSPRRLYNLSHISKKIRKKKKRKTSFRQASVEWSCCFSVSCGVIMAASSSVPSPLCVFLLCARPAACLSSAARILYPHCTCGGETDTWTSPSCRRRNFIPLFFYFSSPPKVGFHEKHTHTRSNLCT